MTEDLFSQRPRTLRGNKRIKRLSGPPAWRMMRQGKASPRETNQTIVWHSQTFSTVKPGEQEKRWKNSGWSYHLQNHVGMVSKDLIIGMELNFLKTKRKKRKKKREKKRKRKEREEKGEKEGKKSERPRGGENTTGQAQKELFYKTLCCYVWTPTLEKKRKTSTRQGPQESKSESAQFVTPASVSASFHLLLGKTPSAQICSIKQSKKKKRKNLSVWDI